MPHKTLILALGILGNVISIVTYISPLPTFVRVYRKKSTEGFQSIPYLVALVSAMLWLYYATLKSNDMYLLTVNGVGSFMETIYIVVFTIYAPRKARILTLKLLVLWDFVGFLAILLPTHFFAKGSVRLHIVGWFCVSLSAALFAAPLSITRQVICTKSVEFMPFPLSLCLFLSAVMWSLYGILEKDIFIALPNILGVALGTMQLLLYAIYRRGENDEHQKFSEQDDPSKRTLEGHVVVPIGIADSGMNEVENVLFVVLDDEQGAKRCENSNEASTCQVQLSREGAI